MSSRINSTITNLDQTLQSFALDAWRQFFKTKGLKPQCGWKGVSKAFSKFLSQHENPALRIMARLMEADHRRDDTMRRWVDQSLPESEMLALREKCIYTSKTRRDSTPEKVETVQPMPQPVEEKLVEMAADPSVPDLSDYFCDLGETMLKIMEGEVSRHIVPRLEQLESTLDSIIDPMTDPE